MSTLSYWEQNDFSGGENSLAQPDAIAENQVAELVNLLPRKTTRGVETRPGTDLVVDTGSLPVTTVFYKRNTSEENFLIFTIKDSTTIRYKYANLSSTYNEQYSIASIASALGSEVIDSGGGSLSWYENMTVDDWDDSDNSVWDSTDSTLWYDGSEFIEKIMEFSVEIPNGDSLVEINSQEYNGFDAGKFELYTKEAVEDEWTYVNLYDVGSACGVTYDGATGGLRYFQIRPYEGGSPSSAGTIVSVIVLSTDLAIEFHTEANGEELVHFVDWDGNWILFSDGTNGLYEYELEEVAAVRVLDKSANGTPNAPSGKYLITHKGRLFMASGSTVYVSGSDDSVNKRYESWSGLSASSGGSIDVVPYSEDVTGLASSYEGVIVFKRSSTHLWSYSEASAPWNAATGGQVDKISGGIGCVSHYSIVNSDNGVFFAGREASGVVGLYVLNGGNIEKVSDIVQDKMRSIVLSDSKPLYGSMTDGYYLMRGNVSQIGREGLVAAFDTRSGAWSTFSGIDANCMKFSPMYDAVLIGCENGDIVKYPSTGYTDKNYTPIEWRIKTAKIVADDFGGDLYARLLRLRGGSLGVSKVYAEMLGDNQETQAIADIDLNSVISDVWDATDSSVWNASDGTTWELPRELFETTSEIGYRSAGVQLLLSGTVYEKTYIDYISIGFRKRRTRNVNYA